MKLQIEKYINQVKEWPEEGHHIMAHYNEHDIVVYQAYRPQIGHFAAKHQYFGGPFSLNRMTWIKPNFLWMMYRSGWGRKEGQEVILAVHLKRKTFEYYLSESVYSSFEASGFNEQDAWKSAVGKSSARLQWDPDHGPHGNKLVRRAIQIGLRNNLIKSYAHDDIIEIEDISDFVSEQYEYVRTNSLDQLYMPKEQPLIFEDDHLNRHLKLIE